jgi:hypothetical protein
VGWGATSCSADLHAHSRVLRACPRCARRSSCWARCFTRATRRWPPRSGRRCSRTSAASPPRTLSLSRRRASRRWRTQRHACRCGPDPTPSPHLTTLASLSPSHSLSLSLSLSRRRASRRWRTQRHACRCGPDPTPSPHLTTLASRSPAARAVSMSRERRPPCSRERVGSPTLQPLQGTLLRLIGERERVCAELRAVWCPKHTLPRPVSTRSLTPDARVFRSSLQLRAIAGVLYTSLQLFDILN